MGNNSSKLIDIFSKKKLNFADDGFMNIEDNSYDYDAIKNKFDSMINIL